MTREEKTNELIEQDINDIRVAIFQEDFEFLTRVLKGENWKPYNQLSDKEIDDEYYSRIEKDTVINRCTICGFEHTEQDDYDHEPDYNYGCDLCKKCGTNNCGNDI